ncbi:MAG: cupin domain-containing protein [Myxococcales bacterium]|jgi:uncharacterized cupin superfamily protein
MPKVDLTTLPVRTGARYPKRFLKANGDTTLRQSQQVALGLTAFGANRVLLPPGAASSLRHYHTREDELVIVTAGEVVLLSNAGETPMQAGDIASFPMGVEDGHTFVNRSSEPAVIVAIGNNSEDDVWFYPDVGMRGDNQLGYVSIETGQPFPDEAE